MKNIKQAILLVLILLMLLFFPKVAFGKDYYFPSVKISININTDGSFDVLEERTYSFSGDYHWATYSLPKSGFSSIENFSIADESGPYERVDFDNQRERTFILTETASSYEAKFYYSANNQLKTFTISFKVEGGILAYADVADFYWKLIGTGWDKKTQKLEAFVYLPSEVNSDDIKVFGHGPLNGIVERIGGKGGHFVVTDVPPNTYVEARVLFPSSILNVQRISQNKLNEIMNEELKAAKKADAQRRATLYGSILLFLLPLGLFIWWIFLFNKYGKEYKPSKEIIYERDIPEELPPAVVGYLLRFRSITPADFTATIMNLIRKGFVAIEEHKETRGLVFKKEVPIIYLYRTQKDVSSLIPHEKLVYDFLFEDVNYTSLLSLIRNPKKLTEMAKLVKDKENPLPDFAGKKNDVVTTEEIQGFIKAHPKEFKSLYDTFSSVVKDEGEKHEFFEKMPAPVKAFTAIAILMPFLSFLFLTTFVVKNPVFAVFIPVYFIISGVFIALIFPLSRRSHKGAEAYAEWNGLKKFLRDFSSLNAVTPPSIALWEAYLVYAVTFGISKRVIEQMKIALPNISEDDLRTSHFFAASAIATSGNIAGSFESIVNTMVSSFNAITTSATSSSTGGGGGFSGGGGGGGGGSGGGAG